jgi:hypothetical protein
MRVKYWVPGELERGAEWGARQAPAGEPLTDARRAYIAGALAWAAQFQDPGTYWRCLIHDFDISPIELEAGGWASDVVDA